MSLLPLSLGCLALALRLFTAGLFVSAALPKLRRAEEFTGMLADYRLLPEPLIIPMARLLPLLELLAALALLLPASQIGAIGSAMPSALLLLVFAAAMAVNLRRGRNTLQCGCGTGSEQVISAAMVWRNGVHAAALLGLAALAPAMNFEAGLWPQLLLALPASLVLGLLYQALNQMLANRHSGRLVLGAA